MSTHAGNPFASHFISDSGAYKRNDMSPADIREIRSRLEALEPEFARLGRSDWFETMMGRLDAIEAKARGDRSRMASLPPDRTLDPLADVATLDPEAARDALDDLSDLGLRGLAEENGIDVSDIYITQQGEREATAWPACASAWLYFGATGGATASPDAVFARR